MTAKDQAIANANAINSGIQQTRHWIDELKTKPEPQPSELSNGQLPGDVKK